MNVGDGNFQVWYGVSLCINLCSVDNSVSRIHHTHCLYAGVGVYYQCGITF